MTSDRMTPDQLTSLEAQVAAYEARRVHRRDVDFTCPTCGDEVGTLRVYQRGDTVTVLGLELAFGLIAKGHRIYGPPPRGRATPRTGDRLVVTKPGPVDIQCRCGHAFAVAVPRGGTVDSA